jgi:ATP-dependent Clp protease ATP-binding subunit ClpC
MWQRFTERARRVVFFAQEEAAGMRDNHVGTEHLLLGLIREPDSVAMRLLVEQIGVFPERLRAAVEHETPRGPGNQGGDMQLTPRAKRTIDLAYEEARGLHNNYIGTEHLLLGLIAEGESIAARVLIAHGVELEVARRHVEALQAAERP